MVSGLVTGNIAVWQFHYAACFVALWDAIRNGEEAGGNPEVAVILRVACFGRYFMAEFGRSGHIGDFY